jgi:serine protease inhibitor
MSLRYENVEQMNEFSRRMQSFVLTQSDAFSINNSVWIKESYQSKVKQPFLDDVVKHYGAMVAVLDFGLSSAAPTINQWVKENTKGRIEEVIKPPIDPLTVMFLINTLTFGAKWDVPFDKKLTKNDTFLNIADKVQYIVGSQMLPYVEDDRAQMTAFLTDDQKQEVLILLPKTNVELSIADIDEYLGKPMTESSVVVQLPKVMIHAEAELKETLGQMGMPSAFLDDIADFSNMASDAKRMVFIFSPFCTRHFGCWMKKEQKLLR